MLALLLLALGPASAADPCPGVRYAVDPQTGLTVAHTETGLWREPDGLAFDATQVGGATTFLLEMTRKRAPAETLPPGFAATLRLKGSGTVTLATVAPTVPETTPEGTRWTARFPVPAEAVERLAATTVVEIAAPLPGGTVAWSLYGRAPVFLQKPFVCFAAG